MDVRYATAILACFSMLAISSCDRFSGASSEDGAQARWAELVDKHGLPPSADDGEPLEGSETVAVLTPEETIVAGEALAKNPTVMEVAQLLEEIEVGDAGWIVWIDPELNVRRLARFVQKLEMAGEDPTVRLAVDVSSPEADPDVRGIPLAPAPSSELSAGNAWAAHAPADTKVPEFLDTYRERLKDRGEKLEEFSE